MFYINIDLNSVIEEDRFVYVVKNATELIYANMMLLHI